MSKPSTPLNPQFETVMTEASMEAPWMIASDMQILSEPVLSIPELSETDSQEFTGQFAPEIDAIWGPQLSMPVLPETPLEVSIIDEIQERSLAVDFSPLLGEEEAYEQPSPNNNILKQPEKDKKALIESPAFIQAAALKLQEHLQTIQDQGEIPPVLEKSFDEDSLNSSFQILNLITKSPSDVLQSKTSLSGEELAPSSAITMDIDSEADTSLDWEEYEIPETAPPLQEFYEAENIYPDRPIILKGENAQTVAQRGIPMEFISGGKTHLHPEDSTVKSPSTLHQGGILSPEVKIDSSSATLWMELETFGAETRLKEARFLKKSIDTLVEGYFSKNAK